MVGSQLEAKGFFAALFDFQFKSFITLKFLRVIYTVLVVVILGFGIIFLLASASRGAAAFVVSLVVVPVVTLLYLVFARIWMETIALFFRIGENTSVMAQALAPPGQGPTREFGAPGPGYGPPPARPV